MCRTIKHRQSAVCRTVKHRQSGVCRTIKLKHYNTIRRPFGAFPFSKRNSTQHQEVESQYPHSEASATKKSCQTPKGLTLNNRGCGAPAGHGTGRYSTTLKGSPKRVKCAGRWGTPSECHCYSIGTAGRNDLRLLSGDAFSVVYPFLPGNPCSKNNSFNSCVSCSKSNLCDSRSRNRLILILSRDQLRSLYNICTILVQYLYVYNCTYIVQLLYNYCTTTSVGMGRVGEWCKFFFGLLHDFRFLCVIHFSRMFFGIFL